MEIVSAILTDSASSVFHVMMQNLFSTFGEFWSVDDKLKELRATYMEIKSLLDKLDGWQVNKTAMELLLQDLVGYCYDTEDLVDEIILSLSNKQQDEKPVKYAIPGFRQLTIPGQIVELQRKLEDIIKLIERILPAEASSSKQPHTRVNPSPHCNRLSLDKTPLVAGTNRDDDKQTIMLKLISQQHPHSGVSIIGMDGLGKTTVARTILDDERIKKYFPVILFARVSGEFRTEDIVQKLVADHSRRTWRHNHRQTTESHQHDLILQDHLCSHRSLIILDDLWSVTGVDWNRFTSNYLKSSPGWKILITTRNPKVAKVTQSTPFYLNRMTDEDCKKLIIGRVDQSRFRCEMWKDEIEIIAKKCKGMPIIADNLGLTLSKMQSASDIKDTIRQFEMKELWELDEFKEVFPSLHLNEPKFPQDVKRCFAYCSLFSPNHEFYRDELIQLWEAEGFIQPQQTSQCFDDFLSRSILHPDKTRGKKQGIYKMHEFNQKFAQLLASETFCRVDEGTSNLLSLSENIRHLSLACQNADKPLLKKIEQCKGLRTFLLLHQNGPIKRTLSYNFFHKLQSLRLLDLSHTNIANLPKSIFSKPIFPSKHLRYLDLSDTEFEKLPEPIHILRALQILKLKNCSKLLQLPKKLNQLISLKHFHVNMKKLACLPSYLGKLTNLETLDSFHVGKDEGFKVTELKNMDHLREIHISGLENIRDKEEAQEAMLIQKPSLRKLALEWDTAVPNATAVLEGLQPHKLLHDLVVRNYCGQEFPPWLISPTCQLVSIYLDNCQNCPFLPSLGQLQLLTTLVIHAIRNAQIVDNQFYGQEEWVFPCLELLEFHDMKGLANWTGLEAGNMPCLRALKIVSCPELKHLPSLEHLSCLVNLEINDCPKLQSLPELASSMNGELGELIIMDSALVTERCQTGGADWEKFKEIPYVEIDAARILTKSSTEPPDGDKDKVSINELQPLASASLDDEYKVPQVHQDEVPRSQSCSTTPPMQGDENHNLKDLDLGTRSEDQPTSSQIQLVITSQMAGRNHNLQDEMHRNYGHPPAPSARHMSQHEGQRMEQQQLAPVKPVNKIPPCLRNRKKRKTA